MASTFNPSLPTDKDFVRAMIGDTDVPSNAALDDYTIKAIIAEEANKYLASARCGNMILARNQGEVSKMVDDLKLVVSDTAEGAYRTHLDTLRRRGAELMLPSTQRYFKLL